MLCSAFPFPTHRQAVKLELLLSSDVPISAPSYPFAYTTEPQALGNQRNNLAPFLSLVGANETHRMKCMSGLGPCCFVAGTLAHSLLRGREVQGLPTAAEAALG